jgi:hypothetical protein
MNPFHRSGPVRSEDVDDLLAIESLLRQLETERKVYLDGWKARKSSAEEAKSAVLSKLRGEPALVATGEQLVIPGTGEVRT